MLHVVNVQVVIQARTCIKDSTGDASDGDADCNVYALGQFTDERELDACKSWVKDIT